MVRLHPFPWTIGHLKWEHSSLGLPVVVFILATRPATFNVLLNVFHHPWPPVQPHNEFQGALLAEVAGHEGIMVQGKDLSLYPSVIGDVNLSLVIRESVH